MKQKGNFKVLLIEDESIWRLNISSLIETFFNVNLEIISDFNDAREIITSRLEDFDLIITDIFPSNDSKEPEGFEFIKLIQKFINKPIIVITGLSSFAIKSLVNYKVSAAFSKLDFNKIEFINTLSNFIDPSLHKKKQTDSLDENDNSKQYMG